MVKHGDVESIVKYSHTWFSSQPHVEFQAQIFKVQAFKHRAVGTWQKAMCRNAYRDAVTVAYT